MITSLKQLTQKNWFRSLMLALIMVGLGLSLFSAARYIDLSFRITGNASFQARQTGEQVTLPTEADARVLMAADLELRQMEVNRSNIMISGGAGLVILAVGWLGYDMTRTQKPLTIMPQQPAAE